MSDESFFYSFPEGLIKTKLPLNPTELDLQKHWYRPICTEQEIERILNPANAKDCLLAIRGNYAVDHMRVFRYFLRRVRSQGEHYSLERNFKSRHYTTYLRMLNREDRHRLSGITFGDVFSDEPNGVIFDSEFGRLITISHNLNYFLEFSHIALMAFDRPIPESVRFSALIIALRTMFGFESMDFDADPRGVIPEDVRRKVQKPISSQLQFIVGHECAHHLLDHLSSDRLLDTGMALGANMTSTRKPVYAYSTSHQEEFDADLASIVRPQINEEKRAYLLSSTLIWFGALELFQHARDYITPPGWKPSTHPTARERHIALLHKVSSKYAADMQRASDSIISAVDNYKPALSEYLGFEMEAFEQYGSVYLAKPNTEWRGKELIDRRDYY